MKNLILLMCIGSNKNPEYWAVVVARVLKVFVYFIPYMVIAWTIAYFASWIIKDKRKRISRNKLVKKYFKKLLLVTVIWIALLIIFVIFYFNYIENPLAETWC